MSGLITTRPLSMAAAICPADQSAHRSSPVMTSSRTQESTRVAGLIATGLVGTEQRHDLIRAQASHLCAADRIATDLDYLDLIQLGTGDPQGDLQGDLQGRAQFSGPLPFRCVEIGISPQGRIQLFFRIGNPAGTQSHLARTEMSASTIAISCPRDL